MGLGGGGGGVAYLNGNCTFHLFFFFFFSFFHFSLFFFFFFQSANLELAFLNNILKKTSPRFGVIFFFFFLTQFVRAHWERRSRWNYLRVINARGKRAFSLVSNGLTHESRLTKATVKVGKWIRWSVAYKLCNTVYCTISKSVWLGGFLD